MNCIAFYRTLRTLSNALTQNEIATIWKFQTNLGFDIYMQSNIVSQLRVIHLAAQRVEFEKSVKKTRTSVLKVRQKSDQSQAKVTGQSKSHIKSHWKVRGQQKSHPKVKANSEQSQDQSKSQDQKSSKIQFKSQTFK